MIWIIFAHYIGDWALQNDFVAQNKGKFWYVMFSHCMIWTACIAVVLAGLDMLYLWKILFLIIGHWIMDKIKMNKIKYLPALKDIDYKRIKTDNDVNELIKSVERYNLTWLYIDQIWHLTQCLIVYLF